MQYFLYARRSSDESSHKQTQSLEGQLDECRKVQTANGLAIVDIFQESRTAKQPGRPLFDAMLARIRKGEADAILCYNLDRLSRNPKDSGDLRWMLQEGIIKEIRTPHQTYLPRDSCLITGIETAMAEQFIIHHTERVARGMRQKVRAGGFPHRAPEGYLNNRLDKTIEPDPIRFPLLRRAWELLLTDTCTVPQIHKVLHQQWGYRKRPNTRTVSEMIPLSALYSLFANPFYAGIVRSWGEEALGHWRPMVTLTEFEQAQRILGQRSYVHPVRYSHSYTKLIRCGTCGCQITAEISKGHTYYHCTNRRGGCSYRGIRSEALDQQIDEMLERLAVFPEFAEWAEKTLKDEQAHTASNREAVTAARESASVDAKRQLAALLTMRLREQVTEEEYVQRREELQHEAVRWQVREAQSDQDAQRETATVANMVGFVGRSPSQFLGGTTDEKRFIARHLAQSYTLRDGQLEIELNPCFEPVLAGRQRIEQICQKIEPLDFRSGSVPKHHHEAVVTVWYTILEGIRTALRKSNGIDVWPNQHSGGLDSLFS